MVAGGKGKGGEGEMTPEAGYKKAGPGLFACPPATDIPAPTTTQQEGRGGQGGPPSAASVYHAGANQWVCVIHFHRHSRH